MSTIEATVLEAAIKVLTSTCGALPYVILAKGKKGTQLQGTANGNLAAFSLPYAIQGLESSVEVQTDLLSQIIKGRGSVTLTQDGSSLVVTSGKYKATVHCNDHDPVAFTELSEGFQEIDLSPETQTFLAKQLPKLKIEKSHSALPEVMIYAKVSSKQTFLATYDSYQLCFFTGKSKLTQEFELHVPYSKLLQVVKDLPSVTKLQVSAEAMLVVGRAFKAQLALPAIDAEASISPEDVYTRCKDTMKSTGNNLVLAKDDLGAFIANSTSLVNSGSEITFTSAKTSTRLKLDSPKGTTQVVIDSEGKTKPFGLDLRFVQAIIEKASDKVSFDVVEDGGYIIAKGGVNYVAVLSTSESNGD